MQSYKSKHVSNKSLHLKQHPLRYQREHSNYSICTKVMLALYYKNMAFIMQANEEATQEFEYFW